MPAGLPLHGTGAVIGRQLATFTHLASNLGAFPTVLARLLERLTAITGGTVPVVAATRVAAALVGSVKTMSANVG